MKQSPSYSISHKGQPTRLLNSRPAAICAIAALLFLQGCAAAYVPVETSTPRYIAPVAYRPVPLPGYVAVQPQQPVQIYTSEQLDQLAGPVALYPDPLLAQLLPASTYPLDIVRAAQLVRATPTEDQINAQDWDASVKAIAHYPAVLQYMDANLDWTQQLGQAFIAQPDDLMQSVQRLRQQASNLGNLITTPEQQVVIEQSYVRIIPAQPEIIYIPVYQPQIVYYQPASFITFGIGCQLGSWLDLDCDWNQYCVYRPGWTWNHWHHNIHIEHHHVTHFERHDYRHGERPSSEWHRDSRRPQHAPQGREFARDRADERDGLRDDNRLTGSSLQSATPSSRERDIDRGRFRGEPDVVEPTTAPSRPTGALNSPSTRSSRQPTATPAPMRPQDSVSSAPRPPITPPGNIGASRTPPVPSRPWAAVPALAPSRPARSPSPAPSPAPSLAPSRPSRPPSAVQPSTLQPAPQRPGAQAPAPPRPSISSPPPALRPAVQNPAPSRPSSAGPPRSQPAPSRPAASPAAPSRPAASTPAPSRPAAAPSPPPQAPPRAAPPRPSPAAPAPAPQAPRAAPPAPRPSPQPAVAPQRPSQPAPTPAAPSSPAPRQEGPQKPR